MPRPKRVVLKEPQPKPEQLSEIVSDTPRETKATIEQEIYSDYVHGKRIADIAIERNLESHEIMEIIKGAEEARGR